MCPHEYAAVFFFWFFEYVKKKPPFGRLKTPQKNSALRAVKTPQKKFRPSGDLKTNIFP